MSLGKTMKGVASAALAALAVSAAETPARPASKAPASATPSASLHWAFQPVRDPVPPPVVDAGWCRTPLDRFILAALERQGRQPAPEADRRTWIRRVTLDLTGLAPTVEEIDAFERDDSPEASDRVVDRLLASPRYGERWGRHWLDVVRYADTAGETADYPVPVAWRYRNYVIDAFNADKPYFDFVEEQVAGDLLARQGPRDRYAERVAATGFLAISRRFGFDSENYHHLTLQDTIDTMGQTFLGLTLGCARCHNHKYDPVPATEYYALYGIFESTRFAFPGSEQKQRTRSMVPLIPPEESLPRWREHEARVASLTRVVQRAGLPVPSAVLRSIDDLDGDFELQAPAAGGSKGVLVPPWVYGGPIAVTTDAQSPFRNRYPGGRVGASIPAGTASWHLGQSLNRLGAPVREAARLFINLDFKTLPKPKADPKADPAQGPASHRFRAGRDGASGPAFEVLVSAGRLVFRTGSAAPGSAASTVLGEFAPGTWQNLQLEVDRKARTVLARLGTPGSVRSVGPLRLAPDWDGVVDFIGLDSDIGSPDPAGRAGDPADSPGLLIDHLAIQPEPLAPVSTEAPASAVDPLISELERLESELMSLRGIDGGFEGQKAGSPPASPWRPGPNSRVRLRAESQSPFVGLLPRGGLGIHMTGGLDYDGFGQGLSPAWKADRTGRLRAAFDFRCGEVPGGPTPGTEGTWRYYLGHGAGTSAAVELFWSGSEFFRIDGDRREVVAPLRRGRWYQVAIDLDLKARRYEATLREEAGGASSVPVAFAGAVHPRWDGSIDDVFIDSHGHRPGPKPALDADNFAVQEAPLPAADALAVTENPGAVERRRSRVVAIEARLKALQEAAQEAAGELERLVVEGPFPLAYGVAEGTPRDAFFQVRGEPDQPRERIRRGALSAVGPARMGAPAASSGRLELARWLTDPANPLPTRVMVNRVWQQHFGAGLVATANDFGLRGQAPSHPELLDHLASEFRRSGGSIKALHRAILRSATYRQRSEPEADAPSVTATAMANATGGSLSCPVEIPGAGGIVGGGATGAASADGLFSPFPRRRLGAEETRDAILEACGDLDLSVGAGHPFPSPTRWGYTQHGPYVASYDHNRRSVYLMTQRIQRHPFLALFDGADPNASTALRRTTTVPSQALFFLNDPMVHRQAENLARVALADGASESAAVEWVHRRILRRAPEPAESADAAAFLDRYRRALESSRPSPGAPPPRTRALAAWIRVLLGSNEFLTVD
jgi:hypothetical protein